MDKISNAADRETIRKMFTRTPPVRKTLSEGIRDYREQAKVISIAPEFTETLANLTSQMHLLTGLSTKVNELHAVQTGTLYKEKTPAKLTAKQKRKAEADKEMEYLQSLRANAHRKILNGL